MENNALLLLLESVLGKGKATSKGNYAFNCPLCNHHKPKLEINLETNSKMENPWHCWICDSKGKTIRSLLKTIKSKRACANPNPGFINQLEMFERKLLSSK